MVDDKPSKVIEEVPLGDIAVPVMSGTHEVRLDYHPTPVRRAGNIMTLTSLALLVAGFVTTITLRRREYKNRDEH
jgi:hypothetical protein